MTRLTSSLGDIELANTDTQLLITDCTDGTVEFYIEHDATSDDGYQAWGSFTQDEVRELARLMYARYVRRVPLYTEVHTFDA